MLSRFHVGLLLALSACSSPCTPSAPEVPPVEAPEPNPEPQPDAPAIYTFLLRPAEGPASGTRLLEDGQVQVGEGRGGEVVWIDDKPLTVRALAEVQEILASEELGRLPSELPAPPNASERAPRATWILRTPNGTERTVQAPRYDGIRIPILERLHKVLLQGRPADRVTARFLLQLDEPVDVRLDCQPLQAKKLRLVLARLMSRDHPDAEPLPDGETPAEWLRIEWEDGRTAWATVMYDDGRVARVLPSGDQTVRQLPTAAAEGIRAELSGLDWSQPEALCSKR